MAAVDEIAIKLGMTSADLKTALAGANAQIKSFADKGGESVGAFGKLWDKLNDKVMGTRDLAHAVATALGLNLENIAENIARVLTGVSKAEEDAYKKSAEISDRITELAIKNMRAKLDDEQRLTLLIKERDALQAKLEDRVATSGRTQLEIDRNRLELETKIGEIAELEAKAAERATREAEARAKRVEEWAKASGEANQREFDARVSVLTVEGKIAALQDDIALKQAAIATGALNERVDAEARLGISREQADLTKLNAEMVAKDVAYARESVALDKQLRAIAFDKLSDGEKLAQLEERRRKLVKEIRDAETDENVKKADQLKLFALDETIKKLREILALPYTPAPPVAATLDAVYELNKAWDQFQISVSGGADFGSMSDAMLRGVIQKQQAILNTVTSQGILTKNATITGDYGSWLAAQLANQQLTGAQNQLNQRAGIRGTVAQFGSDAAVMQFGDSAVNRATSSASADSRNTNVLLSGMAQTLNRVFPGQATPIPPIH